MDSFQIPPVGKDDCIPFTGKGRLQHNIGVVRLEEIVRQAQDSPIISYATAIREGRRDKYLTKKVELNGTITEIVKGSGTIEVDRSDKDTIYGICDLYFNSSMFEANPDFMKVVAWQNKVVNAVNSKVRSLIYKQDVLPKIMIGEKLVANSPIVEIGMFGPKVIYSTNQEFEVLNYTIERDVVYTNKQNGLVELECSYYQVETIDKRTGNKKPIQILHEIDQGKMDALGQKLIAQAKSATENRLRGYFWKTYYQVIRRFADVNYNYAITAHKAQGSTYDNMMAIDWDIMSNWKTRDALRILYVGVSRPKKFLFLVR